MKTYREPEDKAFLLVLIVFLFMGLAFMVGLKAGDAMGEARTYAKLFDGYENHLDFKQVAPKE